MKWPRNLSLYPSYWHNLLARGFGLGEGTDYLPWTRVRDFNSKGTSSNFRGIKVPRVYHFFSSLEATYYLLLEREPDIEDIQEQYPILDIHSILRLCALHHVKPRYVGRFPAPFTIDFIVTRRKQSRHLVEARSIKTSKDLEKPSVRRRQAIEHEWCCGVGIDWAYVDTSAFDKQLLSNLRFIRRWFVNRYVPQPHAADSFADAFHRVVEFGTPMDELIKAAAAKSRRRVCDAQNLFRYCAWSNRIRLDLNRPLALNRSIILLS